MGSALQNAGSLIINSLFDFFLFIILLRFLLQLTRADFYNPLSQFVVKLSSPILLPLRRIIPGYAGLDMAALLLAFVIAFIKNGLLFMLVFQLKPHLLGLVLFAIADIISSLVFIYFLAILAQIILSWVSAGNYNPIAYVLFNLTEPIMSRVRRVVPPISGFDLSPIPVLIGLQLINILVVNQLKALGGQFILGV